jgi:RNA polymerase sigma-70 factor, ECF subfamily
LLSNYTHPGPRGAPPVGGPVRPARDGTPPSLVARAIAGDAEVMAALLEAQRHRIVGLARFFTGDAADAEDLAQDILIRVMQRLPGLEHPETFDVWVYRTSRNRCIDHFRRRRLEAPLPALDERSLPLWASGQRTPDESVHVGEVRARLERALKTLPAAWRRAVVLRDLEELSYEEVAERLSLPLGTVKSQISRGRSRLAQALVR